MKRLFTVILAGFLLTLTAHAESYNFSDSTRIDVPEYNSGYGWSEGGTRNDVVGSTINVSGTTGKITDLNVTINNLTSKAFVDMVFVLVGPSNQSIVLASNAGGANEDSAVPSVDITFDDQAQRRIHKSRSFNESTTTNKNLESGSYRLSDHGMARYYRMNGKYAVLDPVAEGFFGDPGNFAEENALAAFNDLSANGSWQLLAFDNYATDATSFDGWTLSFETTGGSSSGAVPEPAEWALIILACAGAVLFKLYQRRSETV